jgi:hypothetical protein
MLDDESLIEWVALCVSALLAVTLGSYWTSRQGNARPQERATPPPREEKRK